MDGPNPQRQLHLRAAKGKNALVFRVHNTKISINAAFCAAKGIVSPNHRAQSTNTAQHPTICAAKGIIQPYYRAHNEERFTPLNSNLRPKNGLKWAGTMDHTDSQTQERPISGRSYGSHRLSSPRTAYIGPEQWTTPTLKPKNGIDRAGTMDRTNTQAQERHISGRITSAELSKRRVRDPGEFLLSPEPSPEASERSVESTDTQARKRPITGRITSAERSKRRVRDPGEFLLSPGPSPEASEQSADSNDGRS